MELFERYWMFAALCLVVFLVLVRLIVRQRLTLQASLSSLLLLSLLGIMAVFPGITGAVARQLGFTLPSNFFFTIGIGALVFQHLSALVTLSRVELRTIALVQELGILQEKLDRLTKDREGQGS